MLVAGACYLGSTICRGKSSTAPEVDPIKMCLAVIPWSVIVSFMAATSLVCRETTC